MPLLSRVQHSVTVRSRRWRDANLTACAPPLDTARVPRNPLLRYLAVLIYLNFAMLVYLNLALLALLNINRCSCTSTPRSYLVTITLP